MAWLYVPGLAVSSSDCTSQSPPIELWVTSSGKPSPRPLLWPGWKTRPWIGLLSGTTLPHSTAAAGVDAWISSLRATRASPSPPPASGLGQKTPGTSGRTSGASSSRCGPSGCSSKTSPGTYRSASTSSTESYRALVSRLRRDYRARQRQARAMSGSGCSFSPAPSDAHQHSARWPTARASNATGADASDREGSATLQTEVMNWSTPMARLGDNRRSPQAKRWGCEKRHGGWNLDDQVAALWPTPAASLTNDDEEPETFLARQEVPKVKGINGNGAGMPLTVAAKLSDAWSTPRASDGAKGGPNQSFGAGGVPLASQTANWGTPTTMDARGRTYTRDSVEKGAERMALSGQAETFPSTHPARETASAGPPSSPPVRTSLRLSPAFVEWLMGWPEGWTIPEPATPATDPTACGSPATAWCHWLRRQRIALSALSWNYELPPVSEPELRQMSLI